VVEADGGHAPSPELLRERLNHLFASRLSESGRPYSEQHVVDAIREALGESYACSRVYLNQLRRGVATNPTSHVISGLSWFFHVPPAYFVDPALTLEMADAGVLAIAGRMMALSPESRGTIESLIGQLERIKNNGDVERS
jgi:hypothetical protein